jgi:hypothetical protein
MVGIARGCWTAMDLDAPHLFVDRFIAGSTVGAIK